ncbi:MAG: hypothetical protein ACFCUL_13725 [Flavobacteriaceae bacterium]
MTIFFTILFIIIAVNAAMMFFSLSLAGQRKKSSTHGQEANASKVFPLDLDSSKFKNAV